MRAVQGVHRGPIMLFQVKMGSLLVFHAATRDTSPWKIISHDLLLPTGRWSPTASPENAFRLASELKPNVVMVMHWIQRATQEIRKHGKGEDAADKSNHNCALRFPNFRTLRTSNRSTKKPLNASDAPQDCPQTRKQEHGHFTPISYRLAR